MEVMSASKAKGFGNSHYCIISVQVQYEYVYTATRPRVRDDD
jgi:hypothetical protein